MSLNEVRFVYGGISIQNVSSVINGEPVTEVTQGQTNIPLTVTIKNESPTDLSLAVATLTFTLNGHSATLTDPSLPFNIAAGELTTLTYSVNIAENATTGECTIDALATVSALIYDDGAQTPLTWTVKSKSGLIIDNVYSEYTKVTKGYSYNLFVTLTNTGETDCMLNSILPTYASGTYTFTFDPSYGLATGTYPGGGANTIIHGNETKTAKFVVEISSESSSGSDTLGAVASATNILSGENIEILTTDNPHIWTIQTPAELNLYDIIASSTLYRGQKNNNIILLATNEGEAELEWYPGSSTQHINFTPVTGLEKSYENKVMVTEEPVINITSDNIVQARYKVDIKQDTATGTDRITADLFGKELNTGVDLKYERKPLPYTEWTIYSERVNTFADGAYSEEKDSFNLPSGVATLTVYAKVENLAANVEYIVHWIAPDGTEVETTTPIITSGQGYFGCWREFFNDSQSGLYKIRVTDSLNLYVCCENTFEIVAPADMDASFTLPLYATVNQPIVASFTFINLGGAVIANATLIPTDTVRITGTAQDSVVFTPDNSEALFSPRLSDVPGYGQATTTFKLNVTQVGTIQLIASGTGFDNNSGLIVSKPSVFSNECTIQNPPDVRITNVTKTSDTVYKNQKNLRVTATIKNYGEATAVITAASITFNIGTYEQELMEYPDGLELELASGESQPITFDVSVDVNTDSGLDTLTINAIWYDKNWPRDMISSANTTWTIAECGIMLSPDSNFNYEQADYMRGQTINVRAYGFAPGSKYYRIRFYNTQIDQAEQVPLEYLIGSDKPYSGLLQASENGYVDHSYTLPDDARIGPWSVTVESYGDNINILNIDLEDRGTMQALQYFRVQDTPHMIASITADNFSIENNDKIFVGDTFKVRMTLSSTRADNSQTLAADTGAIDFIEPYSLVKNDGARGNVELVSGPEPATFTLRAGESKTFEYVYRATEYTGTDKFSFKSSDANYIAKGRNRNLWDHNDDSPYDVFATHELTSNEIDIYIKSMAVDPETLQFGYANPYAEDYPRVVGMICGDSQEIDMNLRKTGNYNVENIRLNSASLNGPIGLDGLRKSISSNYFSVDVASFSNPLENLVETTKVSLTIPYNQASGTYTSTMFLYSDANNNGIFDSGEITAEFNVSVCVNECKVIKVNEKVVDIGGWSKGTTTSNFEVNYFNAGNIDFTAAKIIGEGDLAKYINFSTATDVGNISVGEFKKAIFSATILPDADLAFGTHVATYTIFEDKDGDNVHDKLVEPFDTFQVHMTIGNIDFSITTDPLTTPTTITASPVETSFTAVTGVSPAGFVPLWIKNTSSNGMPLTRIKMKADNFNGEDNNGNHYTMASSAVEIYPGTLLQPLESGASDSFDIEVYIAPGTRSATYNTTLHFYSDDNDNNNIDAGETQVDVVLNVYVKPTEKVKVIDKPVSVTGMSSDVADTFAECEFLCYNLGNVDLEHLKIDMPGRLVQKDVPDPASISASLVTFSFVGDTPFTAPYNSEFGAKVTIRIPKDPRTPEGVYITTVPCKIYNDSNGDSDHNNGECFDEFQIWLQIGEMKVIIVSSTDVEGEPSEITNDGPFTVKNDGALTVTSVVATSTDFICDGRVIPATASVFKTSPKVGTLKPGFERTVNWAVNIPDYTLPGDYVGKIIVWSDTDNNGEIGVAEASATADVKVTVKATPRLSIRNNEAPPSDIDDLQLFVARNSTVKSSVRLYNTGNTPIEANTISLEANNLVFMGNAITTDLLAEAHFSIEFDKTQPIEIGDYVVATITVSIGNPQIGYGRYYSGDQIFSVKEGETVLCSDKLTLNVEFGEKELTLNPNPLIIYVVDNVTVASGTVTASAGRADLLNINVIEKSHCNCNEDYCGETKIRCVTPVPVDIYKNQSSEFIFEIDVDPRTHSGWHNATWTFFEDGGITGCFEEGEFFVDLQINYYIPEMPQVIIEPSHIEAIDIAPGETKQITYRLTNTGNCEIDLSNAYWQLPTGFIENENGTLFDLGSALQYVSQPTGTLAIGESANYVISLTAPDDQELGTYNGNPTIPQTFQYNTLGLGQTIIDQILVVRRGPMVASDTVYQVVASDTFIDCDIATQSYFLSAWICPGLPDPANQYGANLTVVRCDKEGKPKAALSVRMDNRLSPVLESNVRDAETGLPKYSVYNSGAYMGIGPGIPGPGIATFTFCLGNDGKPIYGISGDPITAIDEANPSLRLTFYRVYFAFELGESLATDSLGFSIPPEEQDKIAILLTQSANEANTASTTVYFDGVKLEKTLFEGQDRPTTYHKDTTLVSPSTGLDISGKHKFYEW
ncbi:MAG: hypothetical protein IKO19_04975 [Candidatus Riflebacteria bacterium]|nr:hypothetical protein [Candidatus Riflebacteria bacterium]